MLLGAGCGKKQDCDALADKGDKVSPSSLSNAGHDDLLQTCKDGDITDKQYNCAMNAPTRDTFVACFIGK
jgi:hypothetical protein